MNISFNLHQLLAFIGTMLCLSNLIILISIGGMEHAFFLSLNSFFIILAWYNFMKTKVS